MKFGDIYRHPRTVTEGKVFQKHNRDKCWHGLLYSGYDGGWELVGDTLHLTTDDGDTFTVQMPTCTAIDAWWEHKTSNTE